MHPGNRTRIQKVQKCVKTTAISSLPMNRWQFVWSTISQPFLVLFIFWNCSPFNSVLFGKALHTSLALVCSLTCQQKATDVVPLPIWSIYWPLVVNPAQYVFRHFWKWPNELSARLGGASKAFLLLFCTGDRILEGALWCVPPPPPALPPSAAFNSPRTLRGFWVGPHFAENPKSRNNDFAHLLPNR